MHCLQSAFVPVVDVGKCLIQLSGLSLAHLSVEDTVLLEHVSDNNSIVERVHRSR